MEPEHYSQIYITGIDYHNAHVVFGGALYNISLDDDSPDMTTLRNILAATLAHGVCPVMTLYRDRHGYAKHVNVEAIYGAASVGRDNIVLLAAIDRVYFRPFTNL